MISPHIKSFFWRHKFSWVPLSFHNSNVYHVNSHHLPTASTLPDFFPFILFRLLPNGPPVLYYPKKAPLSFKKVPYLPQILLLFMTTYLILLPPPLHLLKSAHPTPSALPVSQHHNNDPSLIIDFSSYMLHSIHHPRKSSRTHHPPSHLKDYVWNNTIHHWCNLVSHTQLPLSHTLFLAYILFTLNWKLIMLLSRTLYGLKPCKPN